MRMAFDEMQDQMEKSGEGTYVRHNKLYHFQSLKTSYQGVLTAI